MPLPLAPPKLFATTAIVRPSPETWPRYQLSAMVEEPIVTFTRRHVVPESVLRKISWFCDTATIAEQSFEQSIQRHQWFAWPSGIDAACHVAPPLLLRTSGPFC